MDFLSELLSSFLGGDVIKALAKKTGIKASDLKKFVSQALPYLLENLTKNASSEEGASSLLAALMEHTDSRSVDKQIADASFQAVQAERDCRFRHPQQHRPRSADVSFQRCFRCKENQQPEEILVLRSSGRPLRAQAFHRQEENKVEIGRRVQRRFAALRSAFQEVSAGWDEAHTKRIPGRSPSDPAGGIFVEKD